MTTGHLNRPAYFLGLREIAAWQLESPVPVHVQPFSNDHENPLFAELPALQRGAVWSASQTEALWDSLVRGFPIGSFFFAPYQEGCGRGAYQLGKGSLSAPDFLLLDGQQRATAIALGFLDLWADSAKYEDGPALWVDLEPAMAGDRVFVFRLLTRSHPWGYDRDDPTKRLAQSDIRDALKCYREVSGVHSPAAKLPLRRAWPWDARCPIPVSVLLSCIGAADIGAVLSQRLQALPMWSKEANLKDGGNLTERWAAAIASFRQDDKENRLGRLVNAMRQQLSAERIPALVLPNEEAAADEKEATATDARKDEVETFFVRVNSAGTPLAGEELIFSSFKAAWSDAPTVLKTLQPKNRQIVTPARLVGLLWRLHSAFPENVNELPKAMPGAPSISDFRKGMRSKQTREPFKDFVRDPSHPGMFVELLDWVRLDVQTGEVNASAACADGWQLPPTLAAQLFAGERGLDILFIAFAWMKCLQHRGFALSRLSPTQRKRSLGFLVSVHWFAERPAECVSRLWPQLRGCDDLENFFNAERFRSLLPTRPDGGMVMLPMVPPDLLEGVISRCVTFGGKGFPAFDDAYWKPGSRWEHFYGRLAPSFSLLDGALVGWLKSLDFDADVDEEIGAPAIDGDAVVDFGEGGEKLRQIWEKLLDKMWGHRPLIDYAQRAWLARWYPDFDPTLPGQMVDINRPWDYDHIHPSRHRVNNVPAVIREWHQSIGNLRAWPLELNRGDQDDSPLAKLSINSPQSDYFFDGSRPEVLRKASFIEEFSEWKDWQETVPLPVVDHRYLAHSSSHEQRQALLRAITHRFCRLYREWYENFAIADLQLR
jgi:hypothetical protein